MMSTLPQAHHSYTTPPVANHYATYGLHNNPYLSRHNDDLYKRDKYPSHLDYLREKVHSYDYLRDGTSLRDKYGEQYHTSRYGGNPYLNTL